MSRGSTLPYRLVIWASGWTCRNFWNNPSLRGLHVCYLRSLHTKPLRKCARPSIVFLDPQAITILVSASTCDEATGEYNEG